MRPYEVLFIVKPEFEEEQVDTIIEKYTNLIQTEGGEIVKVDKWGKRKLAYEIANKYREGIYTLIQFNSEPVVASELDRVMKISDEIMRHLISKIEE